MDDATQYQNSSAQYENVHQQNDQSQQKKYSRIRITTISRVIQIKEHSQQQSQSYTGGYENRRGCSVITDPQKTAVIFILDHCCHCDGFVLVAELIAVVVGVAVGLAGGMAGCAAAGIFRVFAGGGIAGSGFIFPGVGCHQS